MRHLCSYEHPSFCLPSPNATKQLGEGQSISRIFGGKTVQLPHVIVSDNRVPATPDPQLAKFETGTALELARRMPKCLREALQDEGREQRMATNQGGGCVWSRTIIVLPHARSGTRKRCEDFLNSPGPVHIILSHWVMEEEFRTRHTG